MRLAAIARPPVLALIALLGVSQLPQRHARDTPCNAGGWVVARADRDVIVPPHIDTAMVHAPPDTHDRIDLAPTILDTVLSAFVAVLPALGLTPEA